MTSLNGYGRPECAGCGLSVGDLFYRVDDHGPLCATCMTLLKLGMHPKWPVEGLDLLSPPPEVPDG